MKKEIKRIGKEKRKQMLEELQKACRGSNQMDTALGLLIINGNEDALKAEKARQKAGVKVQKYCQILKEAGCSASDEAASEAGNGSAFEDAGRKFMNTVHTPQYVEQLQCADRQRAECSQRNL